MNHRIDHIPNEDWQRDSLYQRQFDEERDEDERADDPCNDENDDLADAECHHLISRMDDGICLDCGKDFN
jgi:hypothetical protein